MLKDGKDSGLPEPYRITLAISIALLAHTLLMATFPFDLPEHHHNPVTVSVQLTPQGSQPAVESTPSSTSSPVRATPFTIENQATQPIRTVPTTSSPQPRVAPEEQPESFSETEAKPSTSADAAASTSNMAGEKPVRKKDTEQELTLRSEQPTEESTYRSLLVQTIARRAKIPGLDDFDKGEVLKVELELNLMSNGALVGAKITGPSGNDGLDQRVYRAALAASPYPEPPGTNSRQQRFRVEVIYTF
jgi:protein TonB